MTFCHFAIRARSARSFYPGDADETHQAVYGRNVEAVKEDRPESAAKGRGCFVCDLTRT